MARPTGSPSSTDSTASSRGRSCAPAKREPHRRAAQARPWDLIVVDEAHRLKNRFSLNWRFVAGLSKKYMLLLTATPVQNDMDELFNLVTLLKPGQLHTHDRFLERYVASPDRRVPMPGPGPRGALPGGVVRNRPGLPLTFPPRPPPRPPG